MHIRHLVTTAPASSSTAAILSTVVADITLVVTVTDFTSVADAVTTLVAIFEEAFMDVFCDLVYGGGWTDTKWEEAYGAIGL